MCVHVCVVRLLLWSTCQQSCKMWRKYLMPSFSGKLILKLTNRETCTHLHFIFGLIRSHLQREYMSVFTSRFPLGFIQWPLFFYFLPYSIMVKPYLLYQVIKIPSNWRGHKDKHSNTLCFSSMCPWVKWQFYQNHQTKAIWTPSLLFSESWRTKWLRKTGITFPWPNWNIQSVCILHQLVCFLVLPHSVFKPSHPHILSFHLSVTCGVLCVCVWARGLSASASSVPLVARCQHSVTEVLP